MGFTKRRIIALAALLAGLLLLLCACGDSITPPNIAQTPSLSAGPLPKLLPQMDCSTARIPITDAIYALFTDTYGYEGPAPLASKTHGAWLNLADGAADILFLVAPTADELSYFAQKRVDIEMKVYGYDGLVFIGNEANPVQNLTPEQIRDIYSGKIDNWQAVGGENADIIVYIRNPESGSQRLFESLVWNGYNMPNFSTMGFRDGEIDATVTQRSEQVKTYDDMGTITENVLLNQYAIGFNIMSYIDTTFGDSALKLFSIGGYAPTTENFASGKYPFLTTSYVAIRAGEPANGPARQLYDWVGTPESAALIGENSTLTVTFSDSIVIRAGESLPAPAKPTPPAKEALGDFILKLNRQYITREDLLPYTLDELGYLRNGIYALSGGSFKTHKYAEYFSAQSWYYATSATSGETAELFNAYQKKNLALILAYERELQ